MSCLHRQYDSLQRSRFQPGRNLKSKRLLLHRSRICPRPQKSNYLEGYNSVKSNEHRARPSPFQVLLDVIVAAELGQVDEHARGTAPVPPAAVAAVAHPATRRTDPGLRGGEHGMGGCKGKLWVRLYSPSRCSDRQVWLPYCVIVQGKVLKAWISQPTLLTPSKFCRITEKIKYYPVCLNASYSEESGASDFFHINLKWTKGICNDYW